MAELFGINRRSAFIGMCFMMAGADDEFNEREVKKIAEILVRYGFSDREIDKEINRFSKMSSSRVAARYGAKVMTAITKLDEEMRGNLIQALEQIARADEVFHDTEKALLTIVKNALER